MIKEPEGVDFLVVNRPQTEEELKEVSEYIRKKKAARAQQNAKSSGNKPVKRS